MDTLKGLSVLVVDDDPDLRECLVEDFSYHGLSVQEASCGKEAIELIQNNHFDFVFSDMRMPDGDGRFLAKEIKKMNNPKPILFLYSGFNDISNNEKLELDILEIFTKPLDSKVMMKDILVFLKNKKN